MRSLSYEFILAAYKLLKKQVPDVFVETGTNRGGTIFQLRNRFKQLYTVELNKNAVKECMSKAKKKGVTNIQFYQGESQNVLPDIIKTLHETNIEKAIFFLDAHVTNNHTIYTSRGKIDVPLNLELHVIAEQYQHEGLIIIDDTRLLGKKSSRETADADWSKIAQESILAQVKGRKFMWRYMPGATGQANDRIVILLEPKKPEEK